MSSTLSVSSHSVAAAVEFQVVPDHTCEVEQQHSRTKNEPYVSVTSISDALLAAACLCSISELQRCSRHCYSSR